jgi:hypothetical protein
MDIKSITTIMGAAKYDAAHILLSMLNIVAFLTFSKVWS